MRLLALVAGTNDPSNADVLADAFLAGAKEAGAKTEKIRLKDLVIEHFTMRHYDSTTQSEPDFRHVEEMIKRADGVLIATPVWNFSVPAHLKNLIDRMGSFALDPKYRSHGMLKGKPFFLLFTGGTPRAAWRPLQKKTTSHLPTSIRYFGGAVVGTHYEERATLGKGKFGLVVDKRPESLAAVKRKGQEFAMASDLFARTGKLPWKEALTLMFRRLAQKMKRKLGI